MSGAGLLAVRLYAFIVFAWLWAVIGPEDFAGRKVRHRRLAAGAAAAAAGYALLLGLAMLRAPFVAAFAYVSVVVRLAALNVALCAAAAMLLWYLKVWPAGDVKLFTLLSALVPLWLLDSDGYRRMFFAALVNTFLPAQVFVFALAVQYMLQSRLSAGRRFFASLGWRRELAFIGERCREALAQAWARRAELTLPRLLGWGAFLARWIVGMVVMALASTWAYRFVDSPLLLSIGCTAAFFGWGALRGRLGRYGAPALSAALALVLWGGRWGPFSPTYDWPHFFSVFTQVSAFSFFLSIGMTTMTTSLTGGSAAAAYVLPLLMPLVALILSMGGRALSWALSVLTAPLRMLLRTHHAAAPLTTFVDPVFLPAWSQPYLHRVGVMSGLGLFFGLTLTLVRRWDLEHRPTTEVGDLAANALLAPDFVVRLREDEEFFEEHFSTMYPDGLTRDQAEALSEWCRERSIDKVPLAPTISFASWIFVGFMLCAAFRGRHLLEVVVSL